MASIFTFKSTPETKESAKHIWEAQYYPDLTLPPAKVKDIPGSIESRRPLNRLYGKKENEYNRAKSVAACGKWYGKGYSSQNGGQECDEYPFASTYEGSWTADQNPKAGSHFSVRTIPSADNRKGGSDLEEFYRDNRILDHDAFYVKVVKEDGTDMALPAPPVPSRKNHEPMGDLNGDGNADLIAIDSDGTGKLRFYAGRGDGSLADPKQIGNGGWAHAAITHGGDFNGDGNQDVVARVGSELRLYPGNGDGTVGAPQVFKGNGAGWDPSITKIITVDDATGDDYPDVIAISNNKLWLYPGDPDNKPGLKSPIQIGGAGWDKFDLIALDDVDGDGYSDLGARNRNDGMSYFYPGPLNHDLSQRTPMIREQSGDRATTRLYDGVNLPFITSAHDSDGNGRMDMWGIGMMGRGKLNFIMDDPKVDKNPQGDFPWISRSKEVGNGFNGILAIG
ncbi:hypothetical protein FHS39_002401 [Streptomyces olivoverticillatus]|uniref:Deoxyribonuclease NucA/NucB domain-containing protein n=1 Tax=Streptomyces olivoverticillatus TaxID=66427 RepID=A0A7W7LNA7_9ACTN|nr:hypothetical protein [Streptomyces olivoverticillatus]